MKHRLVGAAVLVAFGVILWPVIFDSSPVREISQRSQIPEAPVIERFAVEEAVAPTLPAEPDYAEARAAEPDVVPPAPASAAEPAPQEQAEEIAPALLDQHNLPVQWAVQLGVFGQQDNALDLKKRAERAGYHAILQTVPTGGTSQYRVYVNPKLEKEAAQRLAGEVERKLGVKGYVTRYYP